MKNRDLMGDHFEYIRKAVLSMCRGYNREDIVGIVILHMSVESERFDPKRGTFKTFLGGRIAGRVIHAIRTLGLYGAQRNHGERIPFPWFESEKEAPVKDSPEAQRSKQALREKLTVENAPVGAGIVLGRTMAELPERWRRVLEMRFRDDQTCEEIAQELGVSVWTVVQTTRKALIEMKRLLAARGVTKVGDVL